MDLEPRPLPSLGRRITYLLLPALLLLGILAGIEAALRAAGLPRQSWSDLFDPGVEIVGSARTGFAVEGAGSAGASTGPLPREGITIGCFGDSVTFGSGVRRGQGGGRPYPAKLEEILRSRHPGATIHVRNFGMPGFTSEQGRAQYEAQSETWVPEILLVGYGFNDGQCAPREDSAALAPPSALRARLNELARELHIVRVAHLGLLRLHGRGGAGCERRVSLPRYRDNLAAMLGAQKARGKDALLLNVELGNDYTHRVLPEIAAAAGVGLVELPRLLGERERARSDALAQRLGLQARPPASPGHAVARVLVGGTPATSVAIHFQSAELMAGEPLGAPCRDDGVAPDEKAGDAVWSAEVPVIEELALHYLFSRKSPDDSRYEFRNYTFENNPMRRWHTRLALAERRSQEGLPIAVFGEQADMAEKVHPNAAGYEAVAVAVADAVEPLLAPRLGGDGAP